MHHYQKGSQVKTKGRVGRKALPPQLSQNLAGDPAHDLVLRALDDAAAPGAAVIFNTPRPA